ncbi:putative transcriptional regulator [Aurantiacibacter atlanticus]|uniref:Putative transcriptional regulator n=2 Tax=Aurantiacibacter atlanticus TaxID=1648404 RepID=A0A0H4VF87_9SPHN|nr:putative transcriptional regulator [Aurantiacibacter atlanticus]
MSDPGAAAVPLFDDGKAEGAMRTIGEVSAAFGIKPHVLRYWEQQFPMLKPLKRSGGRRLYRTEDVQIVEAIDRLVNREGYTLKGARKAISAQGVQVNPSITGAAPAIADTAGGVSQDKVGSTSAPEVTQQLRAIRNKLAAALD